VTRQVRIVCALPLCLLPTAVPADFPLLTPEELEARVEGISFDTIHKFHRYGLVSFLTGRRSIWQDDERCMIGHWQVQGDLICMYYEGEDEPDCWTYEDHGSFLAAWLGGDKKTALITMIPTDKIASCDTLPAV
jgi:hypothetical protein